MKSRKNELDVDFIGEQGRTLTKDEQEAISNFIKVDKAKRAATAKRKTVTKRRRAKQYA